MIGHREDGSVNFYRNWAAFKAGFGDASGEYWLGNEYLHYLTNSRAYKLRFDLEDWDGNTAYAEYSTLRVTSEADNYRLLLGDYSGNASNDQSHDMSQGFLLQNNSQFSTWDRTNDRSAAMMFDDSCIATFGYGGFWYTSCMRVSLTNSYRSPSGDYSHLNNLDAIRWDAWRSYTDPLKTMTMMIRPVT